MYSAEVLGQFINTLTAVSSKYVPDSSPGPLPTDSSRSQSKRGGSVCLHMPHKLGQGQSVFSGRTHSIPRGSIWQILQLSNPPSSMLALSAPAKTCGTIRLLSANRCSSPFFALPVPTYTASRFDPRTANIGSGYSLQHPRALFKMTDD